MSTTIKCRCAGIQHPDKTILASVIADIASQFDFEVQNIKPNVTLLGPVCIEIDAKGFVNVIGYDEFQREISKVREKLEMDYAKICLIHTLQNEGFSDFDMQTAQNGDMLYAVLW